VKGNHGVSGFFSSRKNPVAENLQCLSGHGFHSNNSPHVRRIATYTIRYLCCMRIASMILFTVYGIRYLSCMRIASMILFTVYVIPICVVCAYSNQAMRIIQSSYAHTTY
jgi:Ca2+/Na+ antiporter